jgi:hypothetical protein
MNFEPRRAAPGVHQLDRIDSNGWRVQMTTVDLGDGSLAVHSPTWLGDGTFEALEALGAPRILFAPNHFHHASLRRFRERWPDAVVCAAPGAIRRLAARGHAGITTIDDVPLPSGVRWVPCEGVKTGETWIAVNGTWIVCDSFFNLDAPVTGFVGFALRQLKTFPGLCIGDTFRWLGLADRARYVAWVLSEIERDPPTRVVFSHGAPLEGPDVATRIASILRERLG